MQNVSISPQQAGQVKRRIREQLGGNGSLGFREELEQFQELPYFEVIRPVRELEPEEEEIFDEPAPAVRVADRIPAPHAQRELGEGNFKVRLADRPPSQLDIS